jgi:hypothetical protein
MLELAVTAAHSRDVPTICFDELNDLTDLHRELDRTIVGRWPV